LTSLDKIVDPPHPAAANVERRTRRGQNRPGSQVVFEPSLPNQICLHAIRNDQQWSRAKAAQV